jgi:hypothetical protein
MAKPETGMEKSEMKVLLRLAEEGPISFAFASGKEMGVALLMLDKRKSPKQVSTELEKAIPEAKNTRFGQVSVATDDDNLVKFYVNKAVTGMAKRVAKTLKGTGYNKVQILLEDGTVADAAADDEADEAETAEGGAPAPAATAGAEPGVIPPAPPPPPPQAGPAPDPAALRARLDQFKALIARVSAGNPDLQGKLDKLWTGADVELKTNNLAYAATHIAQLGQVIAAAAKAAEQAPPANGAAPDAAKAAAPDPVALRNQLSMVTLKIPEAAGGVPALHDKWSAFSAKVGALIDGGKLAEAQVAIAALVKELAAALQAAAAAKKGTGDYGKSGKIWAATRKKVEDELTRLRTALGAAYQGTPYAGEIDKQFAERTAPVMRTLDDGLTEALEACTKTDDKEERGKRADAARQVLQRYRAFVESEALLNDLDSNPFAPLALKQTLTVTLGALDNAVH